MAGEENEMKTYAMPIREDGRCPKCGGQVYEDRDQFGPYKGCLECGWTMDMAAKCRRGGPVVIAGGRANGKSHLRPEAIGRRRQGQSEKSVALVLGVSPRQVRRWCQGTEGKRKSGHRRYGNQLGCANTASPCLPDRPSDSNYRTGVLV